MLWRGEPGLRDRSWDPAVSQLPGIAGCQSLWHLTRVKLMKQTKEAPSGGEEFSDANGLVGFRDGFS